MNHRASRFRLLVVTLSLLAAAGCADARAALSLGGRSATVRDITTASAVPPAVDRHCLEAAGTPPDARVVILGFSEAHRPRRIALPLQEAEAPEIGAPYRIDTGTCRTLPRR